MNLSSDLVAKFVDVMQQDSKRNTTTGPIYGTIVEYGGSRMVLIP